MINQRKKRLKHSKGITLIALILTIIILMILAGISFNALTGENGIIQQAMNSSNRMKEAQAIENLEMAWSARMSRFYEDVASGKTTYSNMYKYFTFPEIKKVLKDGKLNRLQYDSDSDTYRITYSLSVSNEKSKSEEGQTYFIEMSSSGKAEIKNRVDTSDYKLGKYGKNNNGNDDFYYNDVEVNMNVYAFYYDDGDEKILAFNNKNEGIEGKVATNTWNKMNEVGKSPEWQVYGPNITKVIVLDKIYPKCMEEWFYDFQKITTIENIENINTKYVKTMRYLFGECHELIDLDLSSFNTSSVTNMRYMFYNCDKMENLDLSSFDTRNVDGMRGMFFECHNLSSVDVSSFNTAKVNNIQYMFHSCYKLESLDLSSFDTSKVTVMDQLFSECYALKEIQFGSLWNTSKITDMSLMFYYCKNLKEINLEFFDTSNVTEMSEMFYGCRSLKILDISSFQTTSSVEMDWMFRGL